MALLNSAEDQGRVCIMSHIAHPATRARNNVTPLERLYSLRSHIHHMHAEPDLTLTCSDAVFAQLVAGKLNPQVGLGLVLRLRPMGAGAAWNGKG